MLKLFPSGKTTLTITSPTARAFLQQNSTTLQGQATYTITGTYSGNKPNKVQVRAFPFMSYSGTPVQWQDLDTSPISGEFKGTLTLQTGYYSIQVRPNATSDVTQWTQLDRIAVGHIVIPWGQSNSACWSGIMVSGTWVPQPTSPVNDCIISRSLAGTFALASDPQPSCDGTGGSAWPGLGDDLYDLYQVPICFTAVGIGGTSIQQWTPANNTLYQSNLKPAVQLYPPNGFLTTLLVQGETDAFNGMSQSDWQTYGRAALSQARTDAGWNFPCGIAIESYYPSPTTQAQIDAIAAAQTAVAGDQYNFEGPTLNTYTDASYRTRTPDFGPLGMSTQASLWATTLASQFGW